MSKDVSIEHAEGLILDQVKFVDFVLKEIRKRNEELQEGLGMTYAKLVGLATPFEEGVRAFRKVKGELDDYLKILREQMLTQYKDQLKQPQQ